MIKILKYLLLSVLVLTLIVIAALVYFSSRPGAALLADIVTDNFNKRFDHRLQIDSLETDIFSRIRISGVVLTAVDEGNTRFASLRTLDVDYRLLDLISSKLTVESVFIDSLIVSLNTDSAGNLIVPRPVSPPSEKTGKKSSVETVVKSAIVQNSHVSYNGKESIIGGAAENISLTAGYAGSSVIFSSAIHTLQVRAIDENYQISDFFVKGNLTEGLLEIDSLRAVFPGLQLSGSGDVLLTDADFPASAELSIAGTVDTLATALGKYLPAAVQPAKGIVSLKVSFAGSKSQQKVAVSAELPRLTLGNIDLKDSRLSMTAGRDSVIIDKMDLNLIGGHIEGEGYLCLDTALTHDFSIRYRNFTLDNLQQTFMSRHSLYNGIVEGSMISSGGLRDPETLSNAFIFGINKIVFKDRKIPALSVKATLANGKADIRIGQDKTLITSQLILAGGTLEGAFKASIPDIRVLAGLINLEQVNGDFRLNGNIQGAFKSPRISGQFSGSRFHYRNFPLDSIGGSLDLNEGKFSLGDIAFSGDLDDLSKLIIPGVSSQLSGAVSYRGKIDGRIQNLAGELALNLKKPSYGIYGADSADVWLRFEDNLIRLDSMLIDHDPYLIRSEGSFAIKTMSGDMKVSLLTSPKQDSTHDDSRRKYSAAGNIAAEFNLADSDNRTVELQGWKIDLSVIPGLIGYRKKLQGSMNLQMRFKGSVQHPAGDLAFSISEGGFDDARFDSLQGLFSLEDDLVTAESLEISYKNNRLAASAFCNLERGANGSLVFTKNCPISVSIDADSIDISLADEFLPNSQLKGLLYGRAELSGSMLVPRVKGRLEILQGSYYQPESGMAVDSIDLRLEMQDSIVYIEKLAGRINNQYLSSTGKAAFNGLQNSNSEFALWRGTQRIFSGSGSVAGDKILFDVGSDDLDVSIFQGFVPGLAGLKGRLNTKVNIRGSVRQPEFRGNLRIDEISFKPAWLDAPLTDGTVAINFAGFQTKLDSAFFRYKKGYTYSAGSAVLGAEGLSSLELDVQARKLYFAKARNYKISLESADLSCRLRDSKYRFDGDIVFGETRVLYRFQPEVLLTFLQKTEKPEAELPDILKKTVFNVRVRASENIWIDNNLAKVRLHSELALTGTPARPNLNGRLSVKEGYVYYLDRRFTIISGILDFSDPVKPDPVVNLLAETNVRDYNSRENASYKISLSAAGRLDEAVIELFSEPPLERGDILSLLTLGFVREKSVTNGSDSKKVSFAGAVKERLEETSSQRISGYFAKKAEGTLGLSQFSVEGNLFNVNNKSGPQLLASRRLSKRMELTYITTVGHMNDQGIRLDYMLNNYFSVEGQTDRTGNSGADLKYRIKY